MILHYIFGRIAFPIFAFCAVEGYKHTKSQKNYFIRILVAAALSQIPFSLFDLLLGIDHLELNVMFTIFLGLLSIKIYESLDHKFLKYFCTVSIGFVSLMLKCDYRMYGVLLIFALYRFSYSKPKQALAFITVVTARYLFRIFYYKTGFSDYMIRMWMCTLIPVVFMILYNGKLGPKLKAFYYWFYPVHLLVLYLISPNTVNLLNL